MTEALTAPVAAGALVLCVAGLAKLRSPAVAAAALAAVGASLGAWTVRAFALAELGVGVWCVVAPTVPALAALACLYTSFSALAVLLARRRLACGCFGDDGGPASIVHSILSLALAIVALAAVASPPQSLFTASFATATVLAIGAAGAAYAIVLAYTQLPRAWTAWSPR